jgi:hypothetical protein
MNTRSSKEYRYIFTTTRKQASTSHLSSRLTDNASGKLLIIFILSCLFVLPTSFLRIPKTHNFTSLQVWHANVLYFWSFCKPTFSGATREWDALYYALWPASLYLMGSSLFSIDTRSSFCKAMLFEYSGDCCLPLALWQESDFWWRKEIRHFEM